MNVRDDVLTPSQSSLLHLGCNAVFTSAKISSSVASVRGSGT